METNDNTTKREAYAQQQVGGLASGPTHIPFRPIITPENIEAIHTFHPWSSEQVERGTAIRQAAKELSRRMMATDEAAQAFIEALKASAIPAPANPSSLWNYAQERRFQALARTQNYSNPLQVQRALFDIPEVVMIANAAITFEAAELASQKAAAGSVDPDSLPFTDTVPARQDSGSVS